MAIGKTVSEILKFCGVSRQAVNNRVKSAGSQKRYTKERKGVTVVTRSGLTARRNLQKLFLKMSPSAMM